MGAGRPVLSWRWRPGPARFGSYRTHGGVVALPYLPPEECATLLASEAVTAVTDYFSSSPLFFGRRVIDVQSPKRRPPTTALSKKLHPLPSSIRRIINLEPPLRGARAELRRRVSTLVGNADSAEPADLGGLGNASQKVCLGP